MHYVLFSKHDHTTLEQPLGSTAKPLFGVQTPAMARLIAQTCAHDLRDRIGGFVSFVEHSMNGPLWIVIAGGQSYGTFYASQQLEDYHNASYIEDPKFADIESAVVEL